MVVNGQRDIWMDKCVAALTSAGFTSITQNSAVFQVEAHYKKATTWGSILLSLIPVGPDTKIAAVSTANVDNIFALFSSPNKKILSAFKGALN